MALFIRQDEERSQLQQRLAAELQERTKKRAEAGGQAFDAENDTNYLKDTRTTTSLAWVWILIGLLAAGLVVWLVVRPA